MKFRSWIFNIVLLLATLVVFFGGIELILRVTRIDKGTPRTPPIYAKHLDPAVSYMLKPNMQESAFRSTVTTNSMGFRSPELDLTKPTIVMLGDSMTFGYGLQDQETVPSQLGSLLEGKYNVLNAGVPGFTLGQEAALYRNVIAPAVDSDALVLIFYFNDLSETEPSVLDDEGNLRRPGWTQSSGPNCNPITVGILQWIPGKCWLDLNSAFYRTVKKIVSARQEQRNLEDQQETFRENAFADPVKSEHLERYGQTLAAFARDLPPELPKLFVIWPEKQLHFFATPRLKQLAEAQGFRVLNLYEVFGNKAETLEWDTVHPSPKTASEAAAVIKAALQYWQMIPAAK